MAVNGGMTMDDTHALSLPVEGEDRPAINRLWNGLLQGGAPEPCGWLKDRWGVSRQIAPRVPGKMLSDPDKARAMRAMFGMGTMDVEGLRRA